MPWVTPRPPALNHLSDETASLALDKHLGNFAAAAKELNISRTDLHKLTWHNPRILNAAHERMWLFRSGVRSKIMEAVWSRSAKRRRWGYDAMFDSYEFRDHPFASARLLAPAPRQRAKAFEAGNSRQVIERGAAAELERERAAEFEADRRREQEGEETLADIESVRVMWAGGLWPVWRDADLVSRGAGNRVRAAVA